MSATRFMRVYYEQLGGHTHIRVFTGTCSTMGKSGDLCMTNEEFKEWKNGTIDIEFKDGTAWLKEPTLEKGVDD